MIYFDNASSTKPSQKCLDVFNEISSNSYANPNSIHKLGMKNYTEINRAKLKIIRDIGLDNNYDIIFNSGATESNNLAILGYCRRNKNRGNHVITSSIEHESVLNVFKQLEKEGFSVTYLKVDSSGNIDLDELKNSISKNTILVSVMASNNEVGTVLDVNGITSIVKEFPKCVFHSDCAQAFGKIKLNYKNFDMFTISAHKIYGLKGIGALIKKKTINLDPIIYGGGQENGLRSGTMDYPAICSFQTAIHMVFEDLDVNFKKVKLVSDYLKKELNLMEEIKLNTDEKLNPYIVSFSLLKKKASVVVEALSNKEIYVSSVSACNSRKEEPSYVLLALGESETASHNSIRVSLGKSNTLEEAKEFVIELKNILNIIRG